jgi:hemerythrin
MAYNWNSTLETGHPLIDLQHKELINAVNGLLTACQQGQGSGKLGPTLDYLTTYTKRHFVDEETLQQKSNYPDYANHRKHHEDLVKVITDLSAELKRTGPTPMVTQKIIRNVGDWLVSHILQQDAKVAAHLKKARVGAA